VNNISLLFNSKTIHREFVFNTRFSLLILPREVKIGGFIMKGYLVLEDGNVFEGTLESGKENIVGLVSIQEDGSIVVKNHKSSNKGIGFKVEGDSTVLSNLDLSDVKNHLNTNTEIYGKIVTDDMPLEYHLYDVKTYIPCGVM